METPYNNEEEEGLGTANGSPIRTGGSPDRFDKVFDTEVELVEMRESD
jgi:hypothetical protein